MFIDEVTFESNNEKFLPANVFEAARFNELTGFRVCKTKYFQNDNFRAVLLLVLLAYSVVIALLAPGLLSIPDQIGINLVGLLGLSAIFVVLPAFFAWKLICIYVFDPKIKARLVEQGEELLAHYQKLSGHLCNQDNIDYFEMVKTYMNSTQSSSSSPYPGVQRIYQTYQLLKTGDFADKIKPVFANEYYVFLKGLGMLTRLDGELDYINSELEIIQSKIT